MKEIVYILGAGVNQVVRDQDGHAPPLLNNFFNIALQKRKYTDDHYTKQVQNVYDYIEKYFKKNKDELAKSPFNLELCFTLLERQINRAQQEKRIKEFRDLANVKLNLESFLAELLSDFEVLTITSHSIHNLGRVIFYEKPTIITFNYDCLMEHVLESASGKVEVYVSIFRQFEGTKKMSGFRKPQL